jgi:hypothetical protein
MVLQSTRSRVLPEQHSVHSRVVAQFGPQITENAEIMGIMASVNGILYARARRAALDW